MLRFFTTLDRFDASRPVKPWLFQIVRNRVHDLHRRRRVRRHDSIDEVDEDGLSIELVDEDVDPERDASRTELRRHVWQALSQLSAAHREILVLRDYHDLAYAEIAETLEIPIGTVMSRLHAARKRLREVVRDDLRKVLQ
jgi:RNA polymerase sigma-70 factor (ECF subfamily)